MGGFGSGGSRVGSGRKSKGAQARWLGGSADKRSPKQIAGPTTGTGPSVDPPGNLSSDERAVWDLNAPHAHAQRTLTPATAESFRELCANIVRERALWAAIRDAGLTYLKVTIDGAGQEHQEIKAHPLLGHHRGMLQRIEAGRARFRLAPTGKEIIQAVKREDPFEEFDQGTVQ